MWLGKDGEQWTLYVYNGGAAIVSALKAKKGRLNAIREMKERQRRGEAVSFPPVYDLMKDGIYDYLTSYRRETGKCPSASTWKQVWTGSLDSGGRMLTATFECSECHMLRKVNVSCVNEIQQLQNDGQCTCAVLVDARCGHSSRGVFEMVTPDAETVKWLDRSKNSQDRREGSVVSSEDDKEIKKGSSTEVLGFSTEAKQFYKAQGKNLQPPCYRGEPSEVDLFAWKRGIERYFETYGIVIERERVTLAADTLDGEAAKWWNGLWMAERDNTIKTWDDLLDRLRERFLPPEGEMQIVGKWRRLHQLGSVASYADYVFRLKALCDMGQPAEFKLVFFGLQPELQAEVRKHLRQNKVSTLELEKLFAVALDAEVGLVRRGNRKEGYEKEGKGRTEKIHGANVESGRNSISTNENVHLGGNKRDGRKSSYDDNRNEGRKKHFEENRGSGWHSNWGWKKEGQRGDENKSQGWSNNRSGRGGERNYQNNNNGWKNDTEEKSNNWKGTNESRRCYICDREGHSWMYCRDKKTGNGCLRCGSGSHRLLNCPQRPNTTTKAEQEKQTDDQSDLLAYQMELKVMEIEGAPEGSRLLYYPVKVCSYATKALLDSGASVNCIDADIVNKVGGYLRKKPDGVLLYPDKRKAKVQGVTQLELRGKGYREIVSFWVVAGLGVPVLLGAPWLRSWNPTIDWQNSTLTFSDGTKWKSLGQEESKKKVKDRVKISRQEQFHAVSMDFEGRLQKEKELKTDGEEEEEEEVAAKSIPEWLEEYKDVFEEPVGVDREGRVKHVIRLKDGVAPCNRKPFKMSEEQKKALREELEKFLDKGWIQPSYSDWATLALVVPKKDGTMRVCIDYRDLNAVSSLDAYPLPCIDELLNKLAKARWFSKMDLASGYHQIPMDEQSIKYTAFRVGEPIRGCSMFEWTVMPMGLASAPATFQRWMENSLQGLHHLLVVYLDDVLIYSITQEQHRKDVKAVLQRFRELKIKVKQKKCEFEQQEVLFLGHVVMQGKISVDAKKLSILKEWQVPLKTVKQVRQLIGFLSYYRAFIPSFASMTAPLTDLLKGKKIEVEWTWEATQAVEKTKQALWDACQRYAWDPVREDRVTTDASGVGIGATLEQKVDGVGWAPVAFWSRKLSDAEKRYSIVDQEWLAVLSMPLRGIGDII